MIKETWLLLALLMPPEATQPRREYVIGHKIVQTREDCARLGKELLTDWKINVANSTPLKLRIMCIPKQIADTDIEI